MLTRLILLWAFPCIAFSSTFSQAPIPSTIRDNMINVTWQPHCPVALDDLTLLNITYWGFDNQPHLGELIVHKKLAKESLSIFQQLYRHHYPIERMELMFHFNGNDEMAMEQNNTSAFNCRPITGTKHKFSQHSYGCAIDLNTKINPYVKNHTVLPKNAQAYVNRQQQIHGMIHKNDATYRLFQEKHWHWGGDWQSLKDYQHFEKEITYENHKPK